MQTKQPSLSPFVADHTANLRALHQAWYSEPYLGALDETMRDSPVIDKEHLPDALWGAVNQVDPEVRLRREEFSEDQVVKAAQCLNVAYASLFELSYPSTVSQQWELKLPGGHFLSKDPIYEVKNGSATRGPESERPSNGHYPPVGYTKGDEGDSIRALVGIAHYVTKLLGTYPVEKLRTVARELGGWPVMLQRGDKSLDAAEAQLREIQLGADCILDVLRHGPDTFTNRILVRELIDIHEYLVDPTEWTFRREQARERVVVEPEESDTVSKEEWAEKLGAKSDPRVEGKWQTLAIELQPLSRKTAKKWWPVIWKKLVEERHGNVHLKAEDPRLADLSGLCVKRAKEAYRRNRLARLRDQARERTGSAKITSEEIERLGECVDGLQAVNCTWSGPAAEKIGIAGMTIDKEIAAPAIRRALERGFKRMFS